MNHAKGATDRLVRRNHLKRCYAFFFSYYAFISSYKENVEIVAIHFKREELIFECFISFSGRARGWLGIPWSDFYPTEICMKRILIFPTFIYLSAPN